MEIILQRHFVSFLSLIMIPLSLRAGDETVQGYPETKLTRDAIGKQVPLRLARRMKEVAAWHGKTETELTHICTHDHHIRADRNGRLPFLVVCLHGANLYL